MRKTILTLALSTACFGAAAHGTPELRDTARIQDEEATTYKAPEIEYLEGILYIEYIKQAQALRAADGVLHRNAQAQLAALRAGRQAARTWHFGVHTGIDIGGAVPWPLSKAVGDGDKMNATPHLTPQIGFSCEKEFGRAGKYGRRWSVTLEATYKTVALDAEIITLTSGQKFKDDGLDVIFYGRATTSMSFTMLEFPLYAKFKFNENNRVLLGGYYSRVLDARFEATALDGRIENPANGEITVVDPSDPLYQNFDDNLDDWDAGFQVGYERRLMKNVTMSGRVSVGFKDIFKPGENYLDYSMWNMRGILTLSYRFR